MTHKGTVTLEFRKNGFALDTKMMCRRENLAAFRTYAIKILHAITYMCLINNYILLFWLNKNNSRLLSILEFSILPIASTNESLFCQYSSQPNVGKKSFRAQITIICYLNRFFMMIESGAVSCHIPMS